MDDLTQKILRNVVFLEARANGVQEDLLQALARVFRDLYFRLESSIVDDQFVRNVAEEIKFTLDKVYENWGDQLSKTTKESVQSIIKLESELLASSLDIEGLEVYALPLSKLEVIAKAPVAGAGLKKWAKKLSNEQTVKIKESLQESIIEGLGTEETASKLRKTVSGINRFESDVVARTMLLQAANQARDEMYKGYEEHIVSYRYLATLDSRTCPICAPYDGRVRKKRSDLPIVPRHPRCRCTVTPWNRDDFDDGVTRAAVFHDSKEVKHRDGTTSTKFKVRKVDQVALNTSYSEWFKTLSAKDQKQILGEKRYEYYVSGKLKLRQFATPNRIKTLKELEEAIAE